MATKVADLLVNIGADTSDLKKELKAVQRQLNYAFGREGMSLSRNAALGMSKDGSLISPLIDNAHILSCQLFFP